MRIAEKIAVSLVILGLVLKFTLIPGGSALFLFSLLALTVIYFYFSFLIFNGIRLRYMFKKHAYRGISGLRLAYVIIAGLSISALLIGIMFKLMYWPGAFINLLVGIFTSAVVLIAAAIKYIGKKEAFYKNIIFRFAPFIIAGIFLLSLSKEKIVRFQYRDHPGYAEAWLERENDPLNEEKAKKADVEYDRMFMTDEEFKQYHPEEK